MDRDITQPASVDWNWIETGHGIRGRKLQVAQGLVKGQKHATIAMSMQREPTTVRLHYQRLCMMLGIKGEDELAVVRRLFELTIERMQEVHKSQIAALERQIEELKGQIAAMQRQKQNGPVPENRQLPPGD